MESQLRAAGFKIMIADTKERQDLMRSLNAESINRIDRPNMVFYVYPDPDVCSCLYVGRETEYQNLQALQISSAQSDRALRVRQMNIDQQAGWGPPGMWGGNSGFWGITNPNSMGRPAWDPS